MLLTIIPAPKHYQLRDIGHRANRLRDCILSFGSNCEAVVSACRLEIHLILFDNETSFTMPESMIMKNRALKRTACSDRISGIVFGISKVIEPNLGERSLGQRLGVGLVLQAHALTESKPWDTPAGTSNGLSGENKLRD